MSNKRFLLCAAASFCVLYTIFVHLQLSYKYYNDAWGISLDESSAVDTQDRNEQSAETYIEPFSKDGNQINSTKGKKYAVILNCEGRSGSTWLSSFFWTNPDVFYVYEPFYPLNLNQYAKQKSHLTDDDANVLQAADIANCHLDYDSGKTIFPLVLGRYPTYQPILKHCKENNNCPATLTSFCKSKTHVVQKLIRFTNMSYYQQLQKQLDMPLKIVHLIRDPRPHIISREKNFKNMFSEEVPYGQMTNKQKSKERQNLCFRELTNIKVGESGFFNDNNYLRLTHEEMSLNPIEWAKKIYNFTGLDFNKKTASYINEITNGKSLVNGGKDPDGRFAAFSVYRDTLAVLYRWMTANPSHIHEIEKECKELIDYLGYVNIYDDQLKVINKNPWPDLVKNDDI